MTLTIEVDDGFTPVRMPAYEEVEVDDLQARLLGRGWTWVLGRCARLLPLERLYPPGQVQVMDLPLVVIDLLVCEPDHRVVAKLQLQFGPPGMALGGAVSPGRALEAVDAVIAWLLRDSATAAFTIRCETPDGVVDLATPE